MMTKIYDITRRHYTSMSQVPATNQSHKSNKRPLPYPTMHHLGTEMCIFIFQSDVLYDVEQLH